MGNLENVDFVESSVSIRALMFHCLLYGDYYIHLLSFRMKIADIKTSQGIQT